MTDLRKAAEMALEALENLNNSIVLSNGEEDVIKALRQALAQPDEVLEEREACAKIVEADGLARGNEGLVLIKAAGRIRARGEK